MANFLPQRLEFWMIPKLGRGRLGCGFQLGGLKPPNEFNAWSCFCVFFLFLTFPYGNSAFAVNLELFVLPHSKTGVKPMVCFTLFLVMWKFPGGYCSHSFRQNGWLNAFVLWQTLNLAPPPPYPYPPSNG